MGSDSHKAHETYTVSPSVAEDVDGATGHDAATAADLAKLEHTLALIDELPGQAGGTAYPHADLAWLVAVAQQEVDELDLDDTDKHAWRQTIAAKAAGALSGCSAEQLQALAAEQGFAHPTLVGVDGDNGALAHWLNPACPPGSTSKAKIQAKAQERYDQLAAGALKAIGGQTLPDVQAAEANLPGGSPVAGSGAWPATPAQVTAAVAALNQSLVALYAPASPYGGTPEGDGGLQGVLDAERAVVTADCPELGTDLATAKAAAAGLVTKQLDVLPPSTRNAMIAAAVDHAVANGTLSQDEASWLDRPSQLALLRASTQPDVREQLVDVAAQRAAQLAAVKDATQAATAAGPQPADTTPSTIASWVGAHAAAAAAKQPVAQWAVDIANKQAVADVAGGPVSGWATTQQAAQLTTGWRQWAKAQKLAELREAAKAVGMDPAGATRAEVQNWIAAGWDPSLSRSEIQAAVKAKATAKAAAQPAWKAKTAAVAEGTGPATSTTPPAGGVSSPPPAAAGSWAAKHAAAVAALQAHQAVAADIPEPQSAATIAALPLSGGKQAAVGGMHPKTFHTDAGGTTWLHKPDKTRGARAHAEAAAAALHNLAGVRTPPVYVREVGGKVGSLQPWVAGASTLSAEPTQWSQADVDGLTRFHVAAWMTSNYDGNPSNMLRTPSGGLAPIDHGQAWRYFGDDRLSLDYDPNGSSYGQPPPAYLTAYKAAKTGKLAKGVHVRPEAALPTIKAFERIPDEQLRVALQPVATEGVKAGVGWVPRMRKAAQKRLGTTAVTDADIAEEFLSQAVARKHNLRSAFTGFFSDLGLDAKGLTKVA